MTYLDQKRRAEQKAASRKADQDRLASGEVTAAQLNEANSLVPRHMMKNARIVRHGRRRITGEDIWDERDRQARTLTDDELREAGLSNHEIVGSRDCAGERGAGDTAARSSHFGPARRSSTA